MGILAEVNIGKRETAALVRFTQRGMVDVQFRARTPTGDQRFNVRNVAWNSIYVPPALQKEIQQCMALIWAFTRLADLSLPALLPLDSFQRREFILAELHKRGLSTPESVHRAVLQSARGRADLGRIYVIDAVLIGMEKPDNPRRARARLTAGRAYLLDAYRQYVQ